MGEAESIPIAAEAKPWLAIDQVRISVAGGVVLVPIGAMPI